MSVFGNFKLDGLEWTGPVLVVPGLRGSGELHWQSLWERKFPQLLRVQQDDTGTRPIWTAGRAASSKRRWIWTDRPWWWRTALAAWRRCAPKPSSPT